MKRLLSGFMLFWIYCAQYAHAQAPLPYDVRDPFGQRLGMTTDQVFEAMKADPDFHYLNHVLLNSEPGSLLCYTGIAGTELTYTIVEGRAKEVMLTIPQGTQDANEMLAMVQKNYRMVAALPDGSATRFRSPYALVLVYPVQESGSRAAMLCFRYTAP